MLLKFLKSRFRQHLLHRERLLESVPFTVTRLGGVEHGWTVCSDLISRDAIVYSLGVGADVSWDLAMIEQFGVHVHAFDPTPESIAWVSRKNLPEQFHFHEFGIAAFDGTLNFYPPKKPGRMHFSQDRQKFNHPDQLTYPGQVFRLSTIVQRLGHSRVDVLKLDVEGTEFDCVPELLQSGIEIGQLLLEVHYNYPTRSFSEGMSLMRQIQAAGFQCFSISQRGYEFGFVNRRLVGDRKVA